MNARFKEISIYEAILARRSIRQYTAEKVDAKRIRSLLEAAVMAPSDKGRAPWSFLVIQDASVLKALSDRAKQMLIEQLVAGDGALEVLSNPSFNVFHGASTLIVICAKRGASAFADCWLAAENMMLAACAMDLGSCITSDAIFALNDRDGKSTLGISDDIDAIAPITIGFPRDSIEPRSHNRPLILNWLEG